MGRIRMIFRKLFRYKLISIFFIASQLVMFYSVFGALSIYNKAYAKEQDRINSLYIIIEIESSIIPKSITFFS